MIITNVQYPRSVPWCRQERPTLKSFDSRLIRVAHPRCGDSRWIMMRRVLQWSWMIALLLSIGLAMLWADSVLTKRKYEVLSLTGNASVLVADGGMTFFGGANDFGKIQPAILNPRGFGSNNLPKEHPYFDWTISTLGVRYCFVTGEISFPATPDIGPTTIRYAEFTIPGLSFHQDRESQLAEARWSLKLSLLVPLLLLLLASGLSWRRLWKGRQPPGPSLQPTAR
jgi:hypothetical protein